MGRKGLRPWLGFPGHCRLSWVLRPVAPTGYQQELFSPDPRNLASLGGGGAGFLLCGFCGGVCFRGGGIQLGICGGVGGCGVYFFPGSVLLWRFLKI